MKVTNPALKNFMYDIIYFEDEVKADGTKVPRTTFNKSVYKGYKSLETKLRSQIDVVLAPIEKERKDLVDADLEHVQLDEFIKNQREILKNKQYISEMFKREDEIELTDAERKALKFFFQDREEIRSIDLELYDQFEQLINI